jgi:hypothetical protein
MPEHPEQGVEGGPVLSREIHARRVGGSMSHLLQGPEQMVWTVDPDEPVPGGGVPPDAVGTGIDVVAWSDHGCLSIGAESVGAESIGAESIKRKEDVDEGVVSGSPR